MSFSITNNSAIAVVTSIGTQTATDGSFTVTSGSFPLYSGQTVSGTNTTISDGNGSDLATILVFLQQGNAQFNIYKNGVLISAQDYSSGLVELKVPILLSSDVLSLQVDEAELPVPSATPTMTPTNTPTPSQTPPVTPTNTGTPTPTPSSTAPSSFQIRLTGYGVFACDYSSNLSGATATTITVSGNSYPVVGYSNTPPDWNFGNTVFITASTPTVGTTIEATFQPAAGYAVCNGDGLGFWDRSIVTFDSLVSSTATEDRYIAKWDYYSGSTFVFTETSSTYAIAYFKTASPRRIELPLQGGLTEAAYFAMLPSP